MIECHWAARTADEYEYRCAEYEYEYEYEEQPIASKLGCSSYSVRFADGTRTRTRTRCSSQNSMRQGNSITILFAPRRSASPSTGFIPVGATTDSY